RVAGGRALRLLHAGPDLVQPGDARVTRPVAGVLHGAGLPRTDRRLLLVLPGLDRHALPDLVEAARAGHVDRGLLHLEHPALDRVAGEFRAAHRVGVAP